MTLDQVIDAVAAVGGELWSLVAWNPEISALLALFDNVSLELTITDLSGSLPLELDKVITDIGELEPIGTAGNGWIVGPNATRQVNVCTTADNISGLDTELVVALWGQTINSEVTLLKGLVVDLAILATIFTDFQVVASNWRTTVTLWLFPCNLDTGLGDIGLAVSAGETEEAECISIPEWWTNTIVGTDGLGCLGEGG